MNNKYPNKLKFHSKENPEEHYVIAWKIKPKQMKRRLGEILTKCNEILEIAKKNNTTLLVNGAKEVKWMVEKCLSSRDLWKKEIYITCDGSYTPHRILIVFPEYGIVSCNGKNLEQYCGKDGEYYDNYDINGQPIEIKDKFKYILNNFDYVIFQLSYKSLFDYTGEYDYLFSAQKIYFVPNNNYDEIKRLYKDILESMV